MNPLDQAEQAISRGATTTAIIRIIEYLQQRERDAENAASLLLDMEMADSVPMGRENPILMDNLSAAPVEAHTLQLIRAYWLHHNIANNSGTVELNWLSLILQTACSCMSCEWMRALGVEQITLIFRNQESLYSVVARATKSPDL